MAELKYGLVIGSHSGRWYPMSQKTTYIQRRGGKFVTSNQGKVTLVASMTGTNRADARILGWAKSQKDAAGQNYWVAAGTGLDEVFVYTHLDNIYEIPFEGALNASHLGKGLDLICTPLSTGFQKAKIGKQASPIYIVSFDTNDASTCYVKIKPEFKLN